MEPKRQSTKDDLVVNPVPPSPTGHPLHGHIVRQCWQKCHSGEHGSNYSTEWLQLNHWIYLKPSSSILSRSIITVLTIATLLCWYFRNKLNILLKLITFDPLFSGKIFWTKWHSSHTHGLTHNHLAWLSLKQVQILHVDDGNTTDWRTYDQAPGYWWWSTSL